MSLSFVTEPNNAPNANMYESVGPDDLEHMERDVRSYFAQILRTLKIDDTAPHSYGTAARYAKMMVREVCRGRFDSPPKITTFPNADKLDEIICTGPIVVRSLCAHHFCPIIGRCWIGVLPGDLIAGLSKFDRIVDWYATRPQVQEELVVQIATHIENVLLPKGVAVVIEASHTCMTWRGVKAHPEAVMATNVMRGVFRDKPEARAEFLAFVARQSK